MRVIPKITEIVDAKKPTEATEFAAQIKYEEAGLLAVKFEQRFPVQPPLPIEPKSLPESPRFASLHKKLSELHILDWEWIRLIQQRAIENDKIKRVKERAEQLQAITNPEARSLDVYHFDNQKFRILMTWMERTRAENRQSQLRLKSQLEHLDEARDRNNNILKFIRLEKSLEQRRDGLEMLRTQSFYDLREDKAVRDKIKEDHTRASNLFRENMRMAQTQVANLLLKQNLLEQHDRENTGSNGDETRYRVHKVKPRK